MSEDGTNERLVRIETKLDVLLRSDSDKEARLRALERRDGYVLGIAAMLAFLAPAILKKLGF
jgi:hypothetical protein